MSIGQPVSPIIGTKTILGPVTLTRPRTHLNLVRFVAKGAIALKCCNRFNQAYGPNNIPQASAALILGNFASDKCIVDNEAFAHMKYNSSMLQNLHCYFGTDAFIIGCGSTHAITCVGDTYINHGTNKTKLQDILLVIRQLTNGYPYNYEFYSVGFVIKEQETN